MANQKRIPPGIKIIIGFHLLSAIVWLVGQGGAVVAYDTVAQWGLQEPRVLIDPAIVEVNRATGLVDIILQTPLFILAVVGLWRLRMYGAVASWLVLGITLYWPLIAWAQKFYFTRAGVRHQPFDMATHIILAFIVLFALWAGWYQYKHRRLFN